MRIRKFVSEIYWPLVFSLLCQNAVVLLKSMKVVKPQKVSFIPYLCVKIFVCQFCDFAYLFEYRRNENDFYDFAYLFEYRRNKNDFWDLATFINLCHQHDCRNNKKRKKRLKVAKTMWCVTLWQKLGSVNFFSDVR